MNETGIKIEWVVLASEVLVPFFHVLQIQHFYGPFAFGVGHDRLSMTLNAPGLIEHICIEKGSVSKP